ncbi:ArdC family protein [Mycoplasma zalophi]|uniref:ArdC family protein n=1 Tax=Mycoplasma zalophi TaxID=191287 RepID=UPI0021C87A17|nr:ArdC family protein [Mycoplasma zalophi]MCU4117195.1 ArdC family protein [Mycoplasma zalophi]
MYQYITISNLENMKLNANLLERLEYIKKQNNNFFASTENVIANLKLLSKFLPYDVANQWLLFKQNKEANKFLTFNQWKKRGVQIKKGEKAAYIIGYKEKTFIVKDNENQPLEWENADDETKEQIKNGIGSTFKKKIVSLIPVFGDNQLTEIKRKTHKQYSYDSLEKTLIKYLEKLKFDVQITKTDTNNEKINYETKEIFINYYDNLLSLSLLKILIRIILRYDGYKKVLENTTLEENMISFLILESIELNNFEYDFHFVQSILKKLSDSEKELFLKNVVLIAKQIKEKL